MTNKKELVFNQKEMEILTRLLEKSTSGISDDDIKQVVDGKEYTDKYGEVAGTIIDPYFKRELDEEEKKVMEKFNDETESSMENLKNLIHSTLGERWNELLELIEELGY